MTRPAESICIAALKGGSGKTVLSVGMIAAWHEEGFKVAAFKKGPDFIDAGWHSFAAGSPCRNLDSFMMNASQIKESFSRHAAGADIALVEGNRGLYDGLDTRGRCSTAELAKLLNLPVILIVDVTMVTRTVAAIVKGCQVFDPDIELNGVILNRVAGPRQEKLIRETVEGYCEIPVVGAVPKLKNDPFPERHMGLVPHQEQRCGSEAVSWAKDIAFKYLDLSLIRKIAATGKHKGFLTGSPSPGRPPGRPDKEKNPDYGDSAIPAPGSSTRAPLRIGVIKDSVFWFYYPENLESLARAGASLIELDSIADGALPPLDALYIGGGFPETQPELLSSNTTFLNSLKTAADDGLPIYAECGGFMYLGRGLHVGDRFYPMAGVLPVDFILKKKPRGHGYTILETVGENPYFRPGDIIKGHEFHYSEPVLTSDKGFSFAFRVNRGHGIDGRRDGMCFKNVLGVYTHIHAAGTPAWAQAITRSARSLKRLNKKLPSAA
ncbi:MAG TPA: cobyrinate a,c-diamide synthase [Desulfobacteraceae bacterium]|nr:cobyrinate a,c-diamide synthase [Desulfobacteraceae bacterium]